MKVILPSAARAGRGERPMRGMQTRAAGFRFIAMIAVMPTPLPVRAAALALLLAAAAAPVRAAGESEAAIVVELLLRSGTAPFKAVSSKPLCVQTDPPELYREPFISGAGRQTRVVPLEYQFRLQRNDSRG